jgi:hypothetical protein
MAALFDGVGRVRNKPLADDQVRLAVLNLFLQSLGGPQGDEQCVVVDIPISDVGAPGLRPRS